MSVRGEEFGNWSCESVGGHPCEFFHPHSLNPHGYVVLYLHGVHEGRLANESPFVEQLERFGLPVVSPRTGPSWWTNRICPVFDPHQTAEQHLMSNILPLLADRYRADPPKIALLGTSMGGQGALRLSYKYPAIFPVVAAISPAIDFQQRLIDPEEDEPLFDMYEDAESARQDTALLQIHPLNWPRHQFFCCDPTDARWFESSDRLKMKLWSLGIPYEADLETVAGGHGFGYYNVMAERAIAFLANGLDRERLRVA